MQFFGDHPTQPVEAIVTFGGPVVLKCKKFLGSESPRLPFLALGNDRLASVTQPFDCRPQLVTFPLRPMMRLVRLSTDSGHLRFLR